MARFMVTSIRTEFRFVEAENADEAAKKVFEANRPEESELCPDLYEVSLVYNEDDGTVTDFKDRGLKTGDYKFSG